jgi:hypothetical protein
MAKPNIPMLKPLLLSAASCAMLIAAISTSAHAAPSSPDAWTRPNITLPKAESAPTVNGHLDDPAWRNALRIKSFDRFTGDAPVVERTDAWVTTDGKTLFVAFHCHDAAPEKQRKSETQRGSQAVWGDDHVSVLVDSQHLHRGMSTFSVNANGTQVDALEGGTAGNITWAGDWKASVRQTEDGWIAELAIPFSMMRHPKGADSIGLVLMRSMNRESNPMVWPQIPVEGQSMGAVPQFMPDIQLPAPMPDIRPKSVILPFMLGTVKPDGQRARFGVDIKQPISTTLTGLVAINPDFQTIEQQVASVNLSYNEQFVEDRRPFFAEGAQFLPDVELLYTRRIGQFDSGMKVVGRQGPTSIGFLSTMARSTPNDRDTMAMSINQASGLFSGYGVSTTLDNQYGVSSNRTLRAFANHGWVTGDRRNSIYAVKTQSWLNDDPRGGDSDFGISSNATTGKVRYSFLRSIMSQDFISNLGLLRNPDRENYNANLHITNRFDKGAVLTYDIDAGTDIADRISTGKFFYRSLYTRMSTLLRSGWSAGFNLSEGDRQQDESTRYADKYSGINIGWNQRTLFQGGMVSIGQGRQIGQSVRDFGVSQGILISKPFSVYARYNQQQRTEQTVRQTIITGTLRLDTLRSVSLRLVSQNGTGNAANVGAQMGTNIYLAYAQKSRSGGADYFFVVGDPNAPNTRNQVTLKVIKPL